MTPKMYDICCQPIAELMNDSVAALRVVTKPRRTPNTSANE